MIAGPNIGAKLLVRPGAAARRDRSATPTSTASSRATRSASSKPGITSTRHYGEHGEAREEAVTVFIESFALPPRMIIFGAVDFTAALGAGRQGARVPRDRVRRRARCSRPCSGSRMADEVVNDWPDRYLAKVGDELGPRDAVCVLTHDHKFDVPAIAAAVKTNVGYLGAMGSRRTHDEPRSNGCASTGSPTPRSRG